MEKNKRLPAFTKRGIFKTLLLMKFLIAFILLTSLQLSAKTYSQDRVTLKLQSAGLKTTLKEIEKKTIYRFLYNDEVVSSNQKVSINVVNSLVTEVLDNIFQSSLLTYRILENNLVVITQKSSIPKDVAVTGKVTSATGEAIPGVTVGVKGAATGTSTSSDGTYSLSVPDGATLIFSSVGYQSQAIPVNGRTEINVVLTAATSNLEQVVVVGYGTARRKDLTGSVASVSGEEIAKQPVLTATQAIQGKVAGVQITNSGAPNALPTVRVRGTGTMLGGANPLYVVDGVITEDIRNINSADIVSLDVLKDASSTAIYGMRAANGVILITTKKGRIGKMVISYDGNAGIREVNQLVNMAGANQYANYLNEASVFYGSGDSLVPASRLTAGINTDWYDAILRQGFQQNHNVSMSGGSEKIIYFFSAGYISDEGILETNKFNRFTVRSNTEYRITSKLKLNALTSFSRSDLRDADNGAFNNAYRAAPYVVSKADGKYGNTSAAGNVANPLLNLEKIYNQALGNRIQSTFSLEYKPISWLTLRSSMGIDVDFFRSTNYQYKYLSDANTFVQAGGNQQQVNSRLGITSNQSNRWVWDNTATIVKAFGKHNFTLLAGTTAEQFKFNSLSGSRFDVPENRDQWYLNAGTTDNLTNVNTGDKFTRQSYLGRLNYGYDNRYLLTATMRADATSRFNKDNRWGYFPSVAVGWNIANEAFMANQQIFDNLKLRVSYGQVGNDQIPTSLYYSLATINVPYYFNGARYLGISFDNLNDKNVRWEVNNEVDFGIDFALLKNRLTGTVDYYNKKTDDALIFVNIPAILGDNDNRYITNAASFKNTGVELSLNWETKLNKDITYSIGGNIALNKNSITGLNGGQALFDGGIGGQGFTTKSDNGQPIGSFFLLKTIGIIQNDAELAKAGYAGARVGDLKYQDIDGNNIINDADRTFHGSYIPKITYGFNGSFNYKNLDFALGGYGTQGSKIYNGKKASRGSAPTDNLETDEAVNRWTPNNTATGIPRAHTGQLLASTYFLESGDFVRLNNLTLGYTLAANTLSKANITRLRVYVTAQNLVTITPYSGFTPELQSGSPLNGGIELNSYPTTRTFAAGVNLTF